MTIAIVCTLLGSLALLIFGMKTMSEALQKMAGPKLRHILARMTTNRFTGMLTGVGVTAAVQSSTATTVMNVVETRLGRRVLTFRGLRVNLDHKTVFVDGVQTSLTRTEFDLLRLLLSNRGQVLSRQTIMDTVWVGVIVSDHTVNVHITRLRKKLGPYARHIVSRQGFGYVFEENM